MSKVQEFIAGELVNLTVTGARVHDPLMYVEGSVVLAYGIEPLSYITVGLNEPGVTVERAASAEWPPQPGDVWRDRLGSRWFAFRDQRGVVLMQPGDPIDDYRRPTPGEVLASVGPLALRDREGWTSTPEATDDEPAEVDERTRFATALHDLADWITENGDAPLPYGISSNSRGLGGQIGFETREALEATAKALGVTLVDDSATSGQYKGAHRQGLLEFWLVWFAPKPVAPILGDDVDDPADTGARTGCECSDCEDIEAGQIDAADTDQAAADAEQVLAAVAEPTAEVTA